MISKRKILLGVGMVIVLAGMQALRFYRQPLGPALDLPAVEQTPTLTAFPITAQSIDTTTALITPTVAPQPLCGGPAVMNILAIGSDARAQNYLYGLADIIRLVRVDFVNGRVAILEVPRDLWVEIPDIADHYNITHGKVNQAYFYGNKGMGYYDGPGEGPGLLARTLKLNFGAQPDHYLAVNMHTFETVVDAVGGIDVNLPYDVSARSDANPFGFHADKGPHHFDGAAALWVARIRQYNVFTRAENQNLVMCALRKKILSPALVPAIPQLITAFQQNVQTDLSPEQINQLACLAKQMHGADVVFASFPVDLFKRSEIYDQQLHGNTFIFDADFNALRDYVNRFQAGTWPDPNQSAVNVPSLAATDTEFACSD
jgi:LCP family protein required for cell wall assembly